MKWLLQLTPKDAFECFLAGLVICTYCYLTIVGKIDSSGFVALAVYIAKKFMDGIEDRKKKGGDDV